jgi:DNA-binding transcriptional regulator YhcF (GntR family)
MKEELLQDFIKEMQRMGYSPEETMMVLGEYIEKFAANTKV